MQHEDSTGASFGARVGTFFTPYKSIGENLQFGPTGGFSLNAGKGIILQLLIDDGVPDRGHRANILSTSWTKAGVATSTHKVYTFMTTIDYGS